MCSMLGRNGWENCGKVQGELYQERKAKLAGELHISESLPLPGPGQCLVGVGLGRHVLISVGAALRRRRQVVLEGVGSAGGEGGRRVPATALLACTQINTTENIF
jgi:hypothetical protein